MAYQGYFTPRFPQKYQGDHTKIVYRSSWEALVFKWLDDNPDVVQWQSEEFYIPYRCATDGKMHRYFPDVKLVFKSGTTMLVEIKPESQIKRPVSKPGKRKTTYIMECFTFAKNSSKWDAAAEYCRKNGWVFSIWGETMLKNLGIAIIKGRK